MAEWTSPGRVTGHPAQEAGPHAGFSIDVGTIVRDYFAAMDWDPRTARPSAERLRRLGLDDLIQEVGQPVSA